MGYQSRKRKYVSGRERLEHSRKIFRILLLFGSLGLAGWIFFNRVALWDWLKLYFY
ncbi:MAG TPA: hypothetical protein PKC40_04515 [Saprospiraceae bacterium]|nr:hypothetical protein [Saprospiraceae bacterium]